MTAETIGPRSCCARWASLILTLNLSHLVIGCESDGEDGGADVFIDAAEAPGPDAVVVTDYVLEPMTVTWKEVQPVYLANCSPCHAGTSTAGNGGTNFAVSYDDALARSHTCHNRFRPGVGRTVAQCAVEKVTLGQMPPNGVLVSPRDLALMREFVIDGQRLE